MRRRPLLAALAAVTALAYLVTMTVVGALPQQRQLVKFEARGIMKVAPEDITRVKVRAGPGSVVLVRRDGAWMIEGGKALATDLGRRLTLAVQFMNTAAPLRIMDAPELTGSNPREFGLASPRLRSTLYRGEDPLMSAQFGAHNPDDTAQYMSLDGKPEIYLMSRFVGQEWEAVATGLGLVPTQR